MRVALIVTTYNSEEYIHNLTNSLLNQQNELFVIFADDGSTDRTIDSLFNFSMAYPYTKILPLPHGERGVARATALKVAYEMNLEYLMFIDADMVLESDLVTECIEQMENDPDLGGLVIEEKPISSYHNMMTKVKVFERTVVNNSGEKLDVNSIEAARFWRLSAFKASGGFHPDQVAFEETQPTIRYIEQGGKILKHIGKGLSHDEKKVTISNILGKKKYHFTAMNTVFETEENGLLKAFKRWYFFRPVMYRKENIKLYLRHPLLTLGMIGMYGLLTIIGCSEIIKNRLVA